MAVSEIVDRIMFDYMDPTPENDVVRFVINKIIDENRYIGKSVPVIKVIEMHLVNIILDVAKLRNIIEDQKVSTKS